MKKLLALLLALMLCASAAFAEEGVFDYTVFEENEDLDFEIDNFNNQWVVYCAFLSTIADVPTGFGVIGTLDGGIEMVGFAITETCGEVKVQVDDTVYTFDTALQALVTDADTGLTLTPETEPFFRALAGAEEVNMKVTVDGKEIDTSITGSGLEDLQLMLMELFEQDVMDCFTEDGEDMWDTMEILQAMTVD